MILHLVLGDSSSQVSHFWTFCEQNHRWLFFVTNLFKDVSWQTALHDRGSTFLLFSIIGMMSPPRAKGSSTYHIIWIIKIPEGSPLVTQLTACAGVTCISLCHPGGSGA